MNAWVYAARPKTLPAAVVPVLLGSALAAGDGIFGAFAALVCLGFALLIQIGTNLANDYYDFLKGADTHERVGPRRAVASGDIAPRAMRIGVMLVFALAFAVGLMLVPLGGWPLLWIGLLCILCGWAYTAGPFPLAYNGMGDVFVIVFFGFVGTLVTYLVQAVSEGGADFVASAQALPARAWLVAWVPGALATNILIVNNLRDMETDARANKRTLIVRFGRGFGRAEYLLLLGSSVAVVVALALIDTAPQRLLPLVVLPMGIAAWMRLRKAVSGADYNALLGASARFLLLFAGLMAAGLIA